MIAYQDREYVIETIRKNREKHRMTKTYMSIQLGFKSPSGYANIEYGKRNLSFIKGVKIFKLLNMGFTNISIESFTVHKLEKYRKERGISITFISRKLGYKRPSSYGNIEKGKTNLSFINAVKISQILNVEIEELFFTQKIHKMSN